MYVGMCMTKSELVTVHLGFSFYGSVGTEGGDSPLLGK